jgi:hypothetical protein
MVFTSREEAYVAALGEELLETVWAAWEAQQEEEYLPHLRY